MVVIVNVIGWNRMDGCDGIKFEKCFLLEEWMDVWDCVNW